MWTKEKNLCKILKQKEAELESNSFLSEVHEASMVLSANFTTASGYKYQKSVFLNEYSQPTVNNAIHLFYGDKTTKELNEYKEVLKNYQYLNNKYNSDKRLSNVTNFV